MTAPWVMINVAGCRRRPGGRQRPLVPPGQLRRGVARVSSTGRRARQGEGRARELFLCKESHPSASQLPAWSLLAALHATPPVPMALQGSAHSRGSA